MVVTILSLGNSFDPFAREHSKMPGPYIHMSAMRARCQSTGQKRIFARPEFFYQSRVGAWNGCVSGDMRMLGQIMQAHRTSLAWVPSDQIFSFFFQISSRAHRLPDNRCLEHPNYRSRLSRKSSMTISIRLSRKWQQYLGPIEEDTAEE